VAGVYTILMQLALKDLIIAFRRDSISQNNSVAPAFGRVISTLAFSKRNVWCSDGETFVAIAQAMRGPVAVGVVVISRTKPVAESITAG
jgi:hypothetical protein